MESEPDIGSSTDNRAAPTFREAYDTGIVRAQVKETGRSPVAGAKPAFYRDVLTLREV
jgi:hypothetical protein